MTAFKSAAPPEITFRIVRQALDQLIYTTVTPTASPLIDLALVDSWLDSTAGGKGIEMRHWALRCVLIERITRQLLQLRQVWGHTATLEETRVEVWPAIQADARTGSPEIIGWSWLYYHYVRVEYEIGSSEYSQRAGIDVRSLRRYQNHALQRLTQQLIR